MKKACRYCGAIHGTGEECAEKPRKYSPKKYERREDIFRGSYAWKVKRTYILKRDKYLCAVCLSGADGNGKRLNYRGLSVHHIKPLQADFDARLDDSNLITLCGEHHEMAENGEISADTLTGLLPLPSALPKK